MKNYLFSGTINREARELLKSDLGKMTRLAVIAGSVNPEINDSYFCQGNDEHQSIIETFQSFSALREFVLLDNRISGPQAVKEIQKAQAVFLSGGLPSVQWQYIIENKLDKELAKKELIIGLSAGAMNQGNISFDCVNDDVTTTFLYEALGYVDFSVFPHWKSSDLQTEQEINNILSLKKIKIFGLPEEAFITNTSGQLCFHGEIFEY